VVAVLLAYRMIRPQKISVTRMWITPIFLAGLTGWVIYANEILNPAPPLEIAVGLIIGAIIGIPFGVLRGMHTDVRPTERRGVMYLGSSWVTLVIFLVAFGLRYGVRELMPQRGSLSATLGDGLLAFAIAFIVASYVVIFRKYERLAPKIPAEERA
jgi:hypothetical protein